ncbi:hypothetical protein FS749_010534 [Ceratobasidium sp. UAMH 11750]|nr:hypothetical protein FS749_010534 [Ceratobasidium sp. UAMH 11750]
MFSTATKRDVVELSDDAESISLMLRFIYPPAFLDILPLPLLKKSLHMAQKYNIDGVSSTIDYVISHTPGKNSPLSLDPTGTFGLAVAYRLKSTQKAAAKMIRPPLSNTGVTHLAKSLPDHSSIIGLLGAHCVRTKALFDFLSQPRLAVPASVPPDYSQIAMCRDCFDRLRLQPYRMCYFPPWMQVWNRIVIGALFYSTLDDCGYIFDISILDDIVEREDVCLNCVNSARTADGGYVFRQWAWEVKEGLKEIFASVEPLYDL